MKPTDELLERAEKAEQNLKELKNKIMLSNFGNALAIRLEATLANLPLNEWPNEMKAAADNLASTGYWDSWALYKERLPK